ncbi:uncharacterized protein LOC108834986 [Raphanus sativus]|uniref:Uncharacterized protein LOC108834986 n=1 Tax=Raphanus sativus TaxID=3726 RepID=A0A6J0LUU0_RAPSA|nr:uncharacterized protein LOC108834986 [Raphanus sativus]
MSKAYDRVEWSFIAALMIKMDFDERLIDLIMCCVTSVSYQVLVNGQPRARIFPKRGLRQGDPLSLFLFILCTEALISLLNGAELEKKIVGLRVARASPRISHLLFADDSIFFCKAEISQCKEIIDILDIYGKASGQRINTSKSSMFFGNRVEVALKKDIKEVLGFTSEGGMGMYLGLPEQICGSKMKVFSFVQDRLNGRVNNWSSRLLSKGVKEVQIKAVAQASLTYVMSCYLLPQGITDKLKSTTSNFWWSSKQNSRGLHWIAWDEICTPKDLGGLGFRDFHDFNLALLAKQLWQLIHYSDYLLARVLKGRYYNNSSPFDDRRTYSPSYGWRSIMAAKPLLISGMRRTIGTGRDTRVWSDPWVPDTVARPPRPAQHNVYRLPQLLVQSFIRNDTKEWDIQLLRDFFHPGDIPLILGIKPSHSFATDGYAWNHTKSGVYTVKSGYNLLQSTKMDSCTEVREPSTTRLKSHVWKIKAPSKIQHFLWQAISGCVATAERLTYRHLGTDRSCPRCAGPEESINHLLFECPQPFRFGLYRTIRPFRVTSRARNDKLFNGKVVSPMDTLQHASLEAECWRKANEKEQTDEDQDEPPTTSIETPPEIPRIPTCQIDASWINKAVSLSALHAEMDGLLWAISCMRERRFTSIRFETDCSDLVDMTTNPEEWPTFATEIDMFHRLQDSFEDVTFNHIPRSRNGRADALAKEARMKGYIFSHIDQTRTDGDAPRRINSSRPHLI